MYRFPALVRRAAGSPTGRDVKVSPWRRLLIAGGMRCSPAVWALILSLFFIVAPGPAVDEAISLAAGARLYSPQWQRTIPYYHPLDGKPYAHDVVRAFDMSQGKYQPGHRGVDFNAVPGAKVYSAADGVVAFVGVIAGVPTVSIDHPGGVRTTYQPVKSSLAVGDAVAGRDFIGTYSPNAEHPHAIHWGAKIGPKDYIDPLLLLAPPRIRLKPVDELAGPPQ